MRYYVFTPGSPGYISKELAVVPLRNDSDTRLYAEDQAGMQDGQRILSRSEASMVPLYREALDRWERRDDAVLQETEVAEILTSRRREAASQAALGCSVAAAALEADDDEAIRAVINEHCHEGCGGRDFPDDPRPRRFAVVS